MLYLYFRGQILSRAGLKSKSCHQKNETSLFWSINVRTVRELFVIKIYDFRYYISFYIMYQQRESL